MAVSRVGGTKGMLSGQVGNTIYQIKNNGDGTFTQIAYTKGERTETTFSPKLQAQRMCMGMVESLMKQLKPLIGISFQAGTNKTKSCNAFSAANLRLVQRDCMEHWYEGNKFVFPYQYKGYPDFSELGGLYMISSGSLQKNLYDDLIFDSYAPANWRDLPYADSALWGLKFNVRVGVDTLEQFRQAHKMTILDKICFAGFKTWISYEPDPEDPKTLSKHDYFIASFNRSFPSNVVLTPDVLVDLFQFKTNAAPAVYISRDNDAICVGCCLDFQHADESYFYWTGFSESHLTGKKQISTSFYGNDSPNGDPYLSERQPSMVFGSWMGEPQIKPYPSPWSPAPSPRLPLEYQEVEWLKKVSTKQWLWTQKFNPSYMTVECYCCFGGTDSVFAVGASYNNISLFLECYNSQACIKYRDASQIVKRVSLKSLRVGLKSYYKCVPNANGFVVTSDFGNISVSHQGWYTSTTLGALRLFGLNGETSNFTLWGVKIRNIQDNSLIYDLVPCYRKSDNIAGFFDLVSSQFVNSNTEVGDFEIGPRV